MDLGVRAGRARDDAWEDVDVRMWYHALDPLSTVACGRDRRDSGGSEEARRQAGMD